MNLTKNIAFFLFLTVAIVSCHSGNNVEKTESEELKNEHVIELDSAQLKNIQIELGNAETKELSSSFKVSGLIDVPPQNMVSVSMPMGGYLKSTQLLPGMHIKKGEIIAEMEDQQYIQLQQDYLIAQSKMKMLELDFQRQQSLNQTKTISDKVFQMAENEYETQKITCQSLAEKLKLVGINSQALKTGSISKSIFLKSPIDGFVSKVNVNIGKYVSATEVLFELVNPTDIHLSLNVFESDLSKVFIGQKVLAYTNNNPAKKYPCEVILIGKDLSKERFTTVHCHFEVYDKLLSPGTYMNAEMQTIPVKAMVLPESAFVQYANKNYVFVQRSSNTFEMLEVETGLNAMGFTAFELKNNEEAASLKYVLKGAFNLMMIAKNKEE
jgi:cobalt-zinc-cadmium efflux system membrane fusion protein